MGKLLYISRCVCGSCGCLNRMLQLLCDHHQSNRVIPPREFQMDLLWFLKLLNSFNGVVVFRRDPISQVVHVDATLTRVGGISIAFMGP